MAKVFRVYDCGEFLMEGTAMEIAKALDMPQTDTIYVYSYTGSKYHSRYTFTGTAKDKRNMFKKDMVVERPKPKTKHQQKLEYLAWHLKYMEGITTLKGNPTDYIDELKNMGLPVRYYHTRLGGKKDYILEII